MYHVEASCNGLYTMFTIMALRKSLPVLCAPSQQLCRFKLGNGLCQWQYSMLDCINQQIKHLVASMRKRYCPHLVQNSQQ